MIKCIKILIRCTGGTPSQGNLLTSHDFNYHSNYKKIKKFQKFQTMFKLGFNLLIVRCRNWDVDDFLDLLGDCDCQRLFGLFILEFGHDLVQLAIFG